MRIALALGLHPIALTTLVVSRPPGDSTRESYRALLNDHVQPIMADSCTYMRRRMPWANRRLVRLTRTFAQEA